MNNILAIFLFLFLWSCSGEHCLNLPEAFNSYEEAITLIEKSNFQIYNKISHTKSSWVQKLEFYSCNKMTGFLIMTTANKKYVHKEVPIETWEALKNAESKGGFYNLMLKNKYHLELQSIK